jgi:hypothetical protein
MLRAQEDLYRHLGVPKTTKGLRVTLEMHGGQQLKLVGERGSIRVGAPFRVDLGEPGLWVTKDGEPSVEKLDPGDPYALELA